MSTQKSSLPLYKIAPPNVCADLPSERIISHFMPFGKNTKSWNQWDPSCQHWRKAACGAGLQTTSRWRQPHERTPPRSNFGKTILHASRVVIHNHNTLHSPPQPVASVEKAGLTNKVPGRQMDEHAVSVWNQVTFPKCALHLSTTSEKVTIKTISIY